MDDTVVSNYTYDDDGIRVSSTVGGTTTKYLVDSNNHTGYAQVLDELVGGNVITSYTIGHDVITQVASGGPEYLVYDGHGSTRALIDETGAVLTDGGSLQVFDYDAYGNALNFDPATAITSILYSGEQTDASGLQYLRARYYDPAVGRFNRLDDFGGNSQDPQSLHKYLYTHGDPVNGFDPSGEFFTAVGALVGSSVRTILNNKEVAKAAFVLDRASTLVDAIQIASTVASGGAVPPALLAGFLSNFVPLGNLLGKARLFGAKAGKLTGISDNLRDALQSLQGIAGLAGRTGTRV